MDPVVQSERCLHELFEFQADYRKTSPAILCGDAAFTYEDVEKRANRLAHSLKKHGARPGMFIGIYFDRSEKPLIAILAVLKAGAAYVPIDPQFPLERIRYILANTNAAILLTERALSDAAPSFFEGTTIVIDADSGAIGNEPFARISRNESGVTPDDLCYIMFTSGTTGRPKGVMTRHRNVVGFASSFNEICALSPADRVYQGFSLGFDGSVEEMWMAFSNGAALVVGTPDVVRYGNEVARLITEKNVTYFSTVPTFLSMISEDLPTVRLLVVSGEQCPAELVEKWAYNGRRMLNVYGPTETTVNATAAQCAPGKKISIGKPLIGYDIHILDEKQSPVAHGETGELYIGGVGVSCGYMNSPDSTKKSFVPNPLKGSDPGVVLYRTGDLVRYNEENELIFLGRIDTQVKIRGYRIELSEIESVLLEHPMVQSAAVKVHERSGLKELAAFIVVKEKSGPLDAGDIGALLHKRLPAYMIPAYLDVLAELPTLINGKINRVRLPEPKTPLRRTRRTITAPGTFMEQSLLQVWKKLFKISPMSVEDDFFLDLGGYSLLAAQLISLIRKELNSEITLRDIYQYSTIKKLAVHITAKNALNMREAETTPTRSQLQSSRAVFDSIPRYVRWGCTVLQGISLYGLYVLGTIPFIALFMLYIAFTKGTFPLHTMVAAIFAIGILGYPTMLSISIITKWLVIGRYKPGAYKVWGWYYFRWWLVTRVQILSGVGFLAGTPLINRYFRLMGAKVGRDSIINTPQCYMFDLLTIGNNTSICSESQLLGYRVEDGLLKIGSITLGDDCFVGISSALGLDTTMENGAMLDDLSLLPDYQVIKKNESRSGSPCRPAKVSVPTASAGKKVPRRPFLFGLLHICGLYCVELFMLLASLPTLVIAFWAYTVDSIYLWIALIMCAIPLYEISFCLLLVFVKKLVVYKAKPGTYPLHSLYYLRNWYIDALLNLSRFIVLPVYTTLYYLPWIRMLGAKVGVRAEFSVISQIVPDVTIIGEESFMADGSIIGGMRMYNGLFQLAQTRIGRRTFLGNSAVLPVGRALGDNCLIGVLSAPPVGQEETSQGTEWLGSPSFILPHRQKVEGFSEETTFRPTKKLYTQRLLVDALRICIPSIIEIFGIISLFGLLDVAYLFLPMWVFFVVSPFISCFVVMLLALCVVGVKNLLMGQYTPVIMPLWSPYVWLNEVVNGAYEAIAAPVISLFFGTPFIAWYLRLLGCKIGKHAFIETALFGEFDLVEIGDYTALNNNTIIQNHLFEDRIFKASKLTIGDECSTGNMSVVLYDSHMQQGSAIGPLSLLMKSEVLPPFSKWTGIPVEKTIVAINK